MRQQPWLQVKCRDCKTTGPLRHARFPKHGDGSDEQKETQPRHLRGNQLKQQPRYERANQVAERSRARDQAGLYSAGNIPR